MRPGIVRAILILATLVALAGTASALRQGDTSRDGKIDSLDALMALRMSVGSLGEDPIADVDGDGRVTAADALKILRVASAVDPIDSLPDLAASATTAPQIPALPSASPSPSMSPLKTASGVYKGDVNGDGNINSLDALLALKMSVGALQADRAGDVDDDGQVTATDALKILRIAVGLEPPEALPDLSMPVAGFSFVVMQGGPPTNVSFNASTSRGNALTYAWDFGDGAKGSGIAPMHTYQGAGTYDVTLNVTDGWGTGDIVVERVTIAGAIMSPVASFKAVQASGTSLTVSFDGTASSNPDGSFLDYFWNFGDGTTGTGFLVTHTYASPGAYTVTLTVANHDGQSNRTSMSLTIWSATGNATPVPSPSPSPTSRPTRPPNQPPVAAFTLVYDYPLVCMDATSSYDPDGTIVSWVWGMRDMLGHETTIGTRTICQYELYATGTFWITLNVTDNGGLTDSEEHILFIE